MHVLFADDDHTYRDQLAEYLVANGLVVDTFDDLPGLGAALGRNPAELVLLDLTVDGADSVAFLHQELHRPGCAWVFLSGSGDEVERIVCLELGADDFIDRSTAPREILARLRALIRRCLAPPCGGEPAHGWRFLHDRREVVRPDGNRIALTTAEFNLMAALMRNQGRPMSRDELFELVFGRTFNPLDRGIDNLIAKMGAKFGDPSIIRTVRPVGYIFTGFPPGAGDPA